MSSKDAVDIAATADIPSGYAARVEIDGTPIAIFNANGTFYAIDDTCTHAEASLSEGELDVKACHVECPMHGATFDLRTGDALTLPAVEPVRIHQVEVADGRIKVALESV